ncbi:MAG TPA: molybdate ABC transporter permease subunit [Thermoanaerobaculia bacterium]|nr:molybdate ABC transporter permease subunit [Thermoanaerobaculia bacterium]
MLQELFSQDTAGLAAFTVAVAAGATVLLAIPGLAVAWALSRPGFRGRSAVEILVSLPLVLPPTAVGLGLLLLFSRTGPLGRPLWEHFGIDIAFTWRGVVLASAVVAFPLFVRSARSSLEEVDPRLPAVARTLGRGPFAAFLAVELPLAWRGVAAGAVLAFARALGEFGATILLAGNIPGRTQTLSLALFQRVQTGRDQEALGFALLSVLLASAALVLSEVLVRRRDRTLAR